MKIKIDKRGYLWIERAGKLVEILLRENRELKEKIESMRFKREINKSRL